MTGTKEPYWLGLIDGPSKNVFWKILVFPEIKEKLTDRGAWSVPPAQSQRCQYLSHSAPPVLRSKKILHPRFSCQGRQWWMGSVYITGKFQNMVTVETYETFHQESMDWRKSKSLKGKKKKKKKQKSKPWESKNNGFLFFLIFKGKSIFSVSLSFGIQNYLAPTSFSNM